MDVVINKLTDMKNGRWVYELENGGSGYVTAEDEEEAIFRITEHQKMMKEYYALQNAKPEA